jgi:hypothetical protein
MLDAVQHRYHWTDDVVLNLTIDRFLEVVTVARENVRNQEILTLQASTFTAWILLTKAYGYKKSWGALLKEYGINPKERVPLTPKEKQEEVRKALEAAERIKKLDRFRQPNRNAEKG